MNISQIGGIGGSLQSFASPATQFTDTLANASGSGGKLNPASGFASETGAAGMTQAFGVSSPQASSSVAETAGKFFKELVNKVNDMQQQSDVAIQQLATGENRNLHETITRRREGQHILPVHVAGAQQGA
ncbi:flagellar hook-basal body complex protein FliE [Trichlorobacter ammonificans]|uniref:Uncharacterized protein n=1 Tax=Trichlorobacter ammonificans TaxID=2916410 RepID=A0ABM9D6H8_9BACT|nr:flagellar hook-basal body complex protein FliE [Trichlorobacter ammonificans]CAH2029985.1 protein of unknown function [Trichlorobacter ammonificans]